MNNDRKITLYASLDPNNQTLEVYHDDNRTKLLNKFERPEQTIGRDDK